MCVVHCISSAYIHTHIYISVGLIADFGVSTVNDTRLAFAVTPVQIWVQITESLKGFRFLIHLGVVFHSKVNGTLKLFCVIENNPGIFMRISKGFFH